RGVRHLWGRGFHQGQTRMRRIMATATMNDGPETTMPEPNGPTTAADAGRSIADMRVEIDTIDAELVRLIKRRTELSHAIGVARASEGGTRIVYSREMKVLERFAELGSAGTDLGMLLLSLGRGQLGRR